MRIRHALAVATLTTASIVVLGCDRKSGGEAPAAATGKGSCNNAPKGFCNDFTGAMYNEQNVQMACKAQSVAYTPTPCPTAGRVGTCLMYAGQPMESHYRYYAAFPGGVAAAEKQCKTQIKGAWSAP